MMEVLRGATSVRLRSCARGLYLAAREEGGKVFLTGGRAARNTVWSVHAVVDADGEPAVLLKSPYGGHLFATENEASLRTSRAPVPAASHQPPPRCLTWHAVQSQKGYMIGNSLGLFLRANGRYLWWRRAVSVAKDNTSAMTIWGFEVVPVDPVDLDRPSAPCALSKRKLLELALSDLDEMLGRCQNYQNHRDHLTTKRRELETERQKLEKIGDRYLLVHVNHRINGGRKTKESWDRKIAECEDDICRQHEYIESLQEEVRMTTLPRRWSSNCK